VTVSKSISTGKKEGNEEEKIQNDKSELKKGTVEDIENE